MTNNVISGGLGDDDYSLDDETTYDQDRKLSIKKGKITMKGTGSYTIQTKRQVMNSSPWNVMNHCMLMMK